MNKMEFLLAMLMNFKQALIPVAIIIGLLSFIMSVLFFICSVTDGNEKELKITKTVAIGLFVFFLPVFFMACIPDINDIWKVRIGLIKLQLSSPENISKASETIERVGHKLECKYLGGCQEQTKGKSNE